MPKGVYKRIKNWKLSQETKNNISKARLGMKFSKETKERMSLVKIGKKATIETKKKMSLVKIGKLKSEETKKKMSLVNTGDKNSSYIDGRMSKKGYYSWIHNKRNRLKRQLNKNGSSHTFGEWELLKKQYNYICPSCKKSEPEVKLTEDHIIPLSKGGSDLIENIQPLCGSCNCKKQVRIIKY